MERSGDTDLTMAVKRHAENYTAPTVLRERIVGAIRQADTTAARKAAPRGPRSGWWLNLGAAFAMGIVASVAVTVFLGSASEQNMLAQEVVNGHVRSLMVAHLADVASSDRHTVKPWFAGKLDFLPPVIDLAGDGFPLLGGRLDYIGGRPAAALVYKSRQHTINVFVWRRGDNAPTPPAALSLQGFNVTGWENNAMQFWLASDLNAPELRLFATRLREATAKTGI